MNGAINDGVRLYLKLRRPILKNFESFCAKKFSLLAKFCYRNFELVRSTSYFLSGESTGQA